MELETGKRGRTVIKRKPAAGSSTAAAKKKSAADDSPAAPKKQSSFAKKRDKRLKKLSDKFELVSCVCTHHCRGKTVREILAIVRKRFPNIEIMREDPGWIIRRAALKEMLIFRPPYHDDYRQRLLDKFPTLARAEVVSSSEVQNIAERAATVLVRMVRAAARDKKVVNVGVAGGHTIRAFMRALATELTLWVSGMPEVIHFRALAAGFNPSDPSTNPNAFVGFFDNRLIPVQLQFTGLSAPSIVGPDTFEALKQIDDIKEAFESVNDIDIFVTSGSSWHKCDVLSTRMPEADRKLLEEQEIIGDLLWRPISKRGPIEIELSQRAFTLVELRQLKEFAKQGKQVLLTLAPCGICRELKGRLLSCALEQEIVTHVVVDTRSAGQALGEKIGS